MSSPPLSRHRHQPSDLDLSFNDTPIRYSSTYSPVTPRSSIGYAANGSFANEFADLSGGRHGGLGSLADELADAWDEDEELQEGSSELPLDELEHIHSNGIVNDFTNGYNTIDGTRDSGIDVLSSSPFAKTATLSPTKHRRKSSRYDGSEYGKESDLEPAAEISPGLEARMAAVEALAKRGMEENGSGMDGIVSRVTEALKDLGSQAGIEGGASRLTTSHTALTSHLAHQTRALASTTSTLLSPLSKPPPPETIEPLLPLITSALAALPRPSPTPLHALHSLASSTRELVSTLSCLADTLQIARQTSVMAERRLRGVREAMAEWRREGESREEGVRWIEKGGWEDRLGRRECAEVCGEVVGGFEEVCEGWRRWLVERAEVGAG